jgi:hypothetical protein
MHDITCRRYWHVHGSHTILKFLILLFNDIEQDGVQVNFCANPYTVMFLLVDTPIAFSVHYTFEILLHPFGSIGRSQRANDRF